jgi:hypothetical protein
MDVLPQRAQALAHAFHEQNVKLIWRETMSTTTPVGTAPTQPEARPATRRLKRGQVLGGILLLALIALTILAAFGPFPWQLLGQGMLLLTIVIVVLLTLGVLITALIIAAITRNRTRILPWSQRLLRLALVLLILLVGAATAVVGSVHKRRTHACSS